MRKSFNYTKCQNCEFETLKNYLHLSVTVKLEWLVNRNFLLICVTINGSHNYMDVILWSRGTCCHCM